MNGRPSALLLACLAFSAASLVSGCERRRAVLGLDGLCHEPLVVPKGHVHVLLFTSHECPIANAYAPTLRELAAAWAQLPVRLFLVHVDPDLTPDAAARHARDYELPGTILLDPGQHLAQAVGATRTPEAVVLTPSGITYTGRIDDRWHALGDRSQVVCHHDLRDAVALALRGEVVPPPHPPAVGCLMPEPRR